MPFSIENDFFIFVVTGRLAGYHNPLIFNFLNLTEFALLERSSKVCRPPAKRPVRCYLFSFSGQTNSITHSPANDPAIPPATAPIPDPQGPPPRVHYWRINLMLSLCKILYE